MKKKFKDIIKDIPDSDSLNRDLRVFKGLVTAIGELDMTIETLNEILTGFSNKSSEAAKKMSRLTNVLIVLTIAMVALIIYQISFYILELSVHPSVSLYSIGINFLIATVIVLLIIFLITRLLKDKEVE